MNTACFLRGRWAFSAFTISSLILVGPVVLGEPAGKKKAKRDAKSVAQMVEAIASPNKPPKLVNGNGPGSRKMHQFPKDYNWKKQKQVYRALVKVYKDTSIEMWEELVRKSGDRRYSLTVTSQQSETSHNRTVGDACRHLAYSRLIHPLRRCLPRDPTHDGWRLNLNFSIGNLREWREERKHKSLYELQIEVCERALEELERRNDELRTVKRISQANLDAARKKIKSAIEKLKRTKQPVLFKSNPFGELWAPYTTGYVK
jgi:hypothetical protein